MVPARDSRLVAVDKVTFAYGGVTALQEVSVELNVGEFVALLGNNGAGKSTLFSLLAGLRRPASGAISWRDASTTVGFAPQELGIYPNLTVLENLELFAGLQGIRRAHVRTAIDAVAEPLFLTSLLTRRGRELSGGEKRRLHTAAALVHQPQLALLDEPTVGVDPETRASIVGMLRERAAAGTTILYSTHYFGEIEPFAPRVVILDHGKVVEDANLHDLVTSHHESIVQFTFAEDVELNGLMDGYKVSFDDGKLCVSTATPHETLGELLARSDWPRGALRAVEIRTTSFEDVFRRLVGATP